MSLPLRITVFVPLLAVGIALAPAAASAQTSNGDTFTWTGRVPQNHWIRIRNLNGPIRVEAAPGDNVEVTGTKQWRRGDPSVVRFEQKKYGDDVVICALWGDESSCDEHGSDMHSHGDRRLRNNDVSVEFHVLVPRGVKVDVSTVNGRVTVDGATAEVDASTVNGDAEASTSGGPVNASTVNGSVRARIGHVDNDADMEFSTVNGSVTVDLPADLPGADVELETVNGSLHTDYEMTVSGRLDPKHLHAHIGKSGGPRIRLTTVNGSVELRRGS